MATKSEKRERGEMNLDYSWITLQNLYAIMQLYQMKTWTNEQNG